MAFKLGKKSLDRLQGVHPDLIAVVKLAITKTPVDFTVLEGLRTEARQKHLVASGASKTMNSRHLTGHAVDLAPLPIDWDNREAFKTVSTAMKAAAEELGIKIEWGGDFKTFSDMPHYQLARSAYP
jgi:peptidoglycan L-alanyl-D-glutamate endopeptidase CwlK